MEEQVKIGRLVKQHMIDQISARLKGASNLFVTECGRLSNKQMEDLRNRLKRVSSNYIVVKNSMCISALKKIGFGQMQQLIEGVCGVSFDSQDPVIISKVLVGFTKENEKFKLKGAYIDGEIITKDAIKELASVPPREILLARLVSSMKSPISGMVMLLSGVVRKLVYVLDAIKDKKER